MFESFGKYKVEIVIIQEGINPHLIRRLNEFPYTVRHDDQKYVITPDSLFEIEVSTLKRIRNLLFLIVREYMVVFRKDEEKAIMRFDSKVSPRVLKVARTSNAVRGMIKEWFKGRGFPINRTAFILIVALIGTIIYAKATGMI